MRLYIDTSAAIKLFLDEADSDACADTLFAVLKKDGELIASTWMLAELSSVMRCMYSVDSIDGLDVFLKQCTLVETNARHINRVRSEKWKLRSADALHLACALDTNATHILTYNKELASAARKHNITPLNAH